MIQSITVDLIPNGKMPMLHASQYDDGRQVRINLTENRQAYTLTGNEVLSLAVRKADNTLVTMDIANTYGGKSYVEFATTEQMTAVSGLNFGELTITNNGTKVGSLNFYLACEPSPEAGGLRSASEINNLNRQIDDHIDEVLPDMVENVAPAIVEEVAPAVVREVAPSVVEDVAPAILDRLAPSAVAEAAPAVVAELVPPAVAEVAPSVVREVAEPIVEELVPIAVGDNYYNKTQVDNKVNSVQSDMESLNNNGYISTIDEYTWSTTSKNVPFNGKNGKKYTVSVTSLEDLNTSSRALYAIRADNSYQVISNNITVGETYEFTANADFVYVRIYLAYSTPPTNNKVKYAIGLKGYCKTEIEALKVDTLKNAESIEMLNEKGELDFSGSYTWTSSNKDIPFNGKNGKKYVVIINSIGNTNYTNFVIYAMRANNTYQTVRLNPYIGERCEFTATADFVKIRFSVTYSTPPSGNVISYTISISGYIYSAINEIKADKKLLVGYPDNIVCIGDSLTDGYVKDSVSTAYLSYYNYPYFLGKIMNTISSKIAQSGYTTKDIWDNYENEIRAVSNSLVVVWLGTNGGLTDTVDTDCVGDDISNYANTNTGYYGRIINTLLSNNNKVVLAYIFAGGSTIGVATTNNAISSLATRFGTKLIVLTGNDIAEFKEEKYHTSEQGYVDATHFSCIGYSFVARSFYGKLEELAKDMPSWFCMKKTQS